MMSREKNKSRKALKMPELAEYFYDFAMLQEVAKIGLKQICGSLTVAHTSSDISPFLSQVFMRLV